VALALGALATGLHCSTPAPGARSVLAHPPDETSFAPVNQMLVRRCGTLDCHGTKARNFRIYGNTGLRFKATDIPNSFTPTTSDEAQETYDSLVALEPEIMSDVVAAGGANPERLTVVRKGRATETHKGGAVIVSGDDQDKCLTSWLAGKVDSSACMRASLP
jgi:hypothetical protein